MFKNLTYKQKFLGILGGFILLSLASYKKTFKQALSAKNELSQIELKLENAQNAFNQIHSTKGDLKLLDNIIGGHTNQPEKVQKKLLDFISRTEVQVNLISIEDVHLFSDTEFLVYTNQIEFEGTYHNLMKILYEIEKNFKLSKVVSTDFHTKKNYRKNTKNLYLRIILQNYEKAK